MDKHFIALFSMCIMVIALMGCIFTHLQLVKILLHICGMISAISCNIFSVYIVGITVEEAESL